jgi:hypothetical protein
LQGGNLKEKNSKGLPQNSYFAEGKSILTFKNIKNTIFNEKIIYFDILN